MKYRKKTINGNIGKQKYRKHRKYRKNIEKTWKNNLNKSKLVFTRMSRKNYPPLTKIITPFYLMIMLIGLTF